MKAYIYPDFSLRLIEQVTEYISDRNIDATPEQWLQYLCDKACVEAIDRKYKILHYMKIDGTIVGGVKFNIFGLEPLVKFKPNKENHLSELMEYKDKVVTVADVYDMFFKFYQKRLKKVN